ncbi:MAG: beta-propeller domain-containing protein [Sedimentisphaerales bacterium]|nr:beta-propeller domain-containing protein [Sedimentisphaerales bacterium]
MHQSQSKNRLSVCKNVHISKYQLALESLEQRCLLNASLSKAGVWTIIADMDKSNPDDDISIRLCPDNSDRLEVQMNGQIINQQDLADVQRIRVKAGKGDDSIEINLPEDLRPIPSKIMGGKGDDTITGGPGNDKIIGGPGNDTIRGNTGQNRLIGGAGEDTIYIQSNNDSLKISKHDLMVDEQHAIELNQLEMSPESRQEIIDLAVQRWQNLFGTSFNKNIILYETGTPITALADRSYDITVSAAGGTDGSQFDYSTTNTQEIDVDEADLVKTNGDYIYVISDQTLFVIDAWPAEEMNLVSQIDIEGYMGQLYLNEDRLSVISQIYTPYLFPYETDVVSYYNYYNDSRPQVKLTTYDLTDAAAPEIIQENYMDGYLVTSRAIEDRIHLVIQNYDWIPLPEIQVVDEDNGIYIYESEAQYRDRLAASLDLELPQCISVVHEDGNRIGSHDSLLDSSKIYIPELPEDNNGLFSFARQILPQTNLISIVSFDVNADQRGPLSTTSVADYGGTIYVSSESLYLVSESRNFLIRTMNVDSQITNIYKFDLTDDEVPLSATGSVSGRVLNQFSMDEEDDTFRIATTSGFGDQSSNSIYILEQQADELDVIGSLKNLALTEQIYSVRFMGDRAYMVTFRQVDPLFTLDLSDPTQPEVVGELKVPGFSAYLHPVDDNYLIGLGRDADENGRVLGMQVSLFDVSDFANPVQVDVLILDEPDSYVYSEALYDHHAFSYFPDYEILALPIRWGWSSTATLQVIEVDKEAGFIEMGEVEHKSDVRRSLRIDEFLYSISDHEIKANAMDDPGREVAAVIF